MGDREDHGFFRAAGGDPGDDDAAPKRNAGSGAEGSRAGWWLRAVYGIATTYTGGDIARAVWDFDLTLYFTLQPAALEAAGQLPEDDHYAIKEGLRAGRDCKRALRAARL